MSTSVVGAPSLSLTSLTVVPSAIVEAETILTTDGVAGLAFDVYSPDRFKVVVLDADAGQLVIGHYVDGVFSADATTAVDVAPDTPVGVRLDGRTVIVTIDGAVALSHLFNGLLNDGRLGLVAIQGSATFEHLLLQTDDPELAPALPLANVDDATISEGDGPGQVAVTIRLSRPA